MPAEPTSPPRPWSEHPAIPVAVFVVCVVVLVVQHQLENPTWVPHGADWDSWYQSVAAILHSGIQYPPNRWPAYALYGSLFSVLPGPMHVNTQVASLVASAGSITGLFLIGRTLLGLPGALTVAALTLTFPMVGMLSSWMSAYPLWATAAIWVVVGLVEALRTGRTGWWVVSGTGLAFVFAIMAKGLGIGLALLALAVGCCLLTGRAGLRNLGRVLAPVVVMALVYLVFPSPLLTLDAQVSMQSTDLGPPASARVPTAREEGQRNPLAVQGDEPSTGGPPVEDVGISDAERAALFEDGYLFGRSMNPVRVYQTLRGAQKSPEEQERRLNDAVARLIRLFPTVDRSLLLWLLAGSGAGLLVGVGTLVWQGRRGLARAAAPLVGWLGLLGIVAGVAPSLISMFTPRFLTPLYFVAPLFLVAPVALIARWSSKLSWLSFAILPVCLLPASPWTASPWLQGAAVEQEMGPVEIPVPEAIDVWYALEQEFPDADIYVMTAPDLGLLALQGREGTLSGGDPRYMTTDVAPPRDDQFILTAEVAPPPGQRLAGRYLRSTTCAPCRGRYIARQMMYDDVVVQLYEPVGGR